MEWVEWDAKEIWEKHGKIWLGNGRLSGNFRRVLEFTVWFDYSTKFHGLSDPLLWLNYILWLIIVGSFQTRANSLKPVYSPARGHNGLPPTTDT